MDIADDANRALERWQACLDLLEEARQVQLTMGESELELARNSFNQYFPLICLERPDDAKRVIESSMSVFRKEEAAEDEARAFSALANIWSTGGENGQAISLERQALAVLNHLPDPFARAISHNSLSNYLRQDRKPKISALHRLASLTYCVFTGHNDLLRIPLRNFGVDIRHAAQTAQRYELPRLADLLADPEFDALNEFLTNGHVDLARLQTDLDQLVESVRSVA